MRARRSDVCCCSWTTVVYDCSQRYAVAVVRRESEVIDRKLLLKLDDHVSFVVNGNDKLISISSDEKNKLKLSIGIMGVTDEHTLRFDDTIDISSQTSSSESINNIVFIPPQEQTTQQAHN